MHLSSLPEASHQPPPQDLAVARLQAVQQYMLQSLAETDRLQAVLGSLSGGLMGVSVEWHCRPAFSRWGARRLIWTGRAGVV